MKMVKDHIHQWKPTTKSATVIVEKECVFVCECGTYKIQKMAEVKE